MLFFRFGSSSAVLALALLSTNLLAQEPTQQASGTTQTAPDASTLLQSAADAFDGGQAVSSVSLSGTVTLHNAQDETGTFSAQVTPTSSSLEVTTGTQDRKDTRVAGDPLPACGWTDANGQHDAKTHNCLVNVDWVLPSVSLLPEIKRRTSILWWARKSGIKSA